jgi:heat shock protein HslJ
MPNRRHAPHISLLAAVLAVAAGCSARVPRLWDTTWQLEEIAGRPALDAPRATLEFAAERRVSGNGSCNRFSGTVTISERSISFGPLATTRMACAEPIRSQETKYLAALQRAERFVIEGEHLTIHTAGSDEPLRFVRGRP